MMFTKRLREPIKRGEITLSIRIWQRPHVKVGGLYPLAPGHIRVTAIREIALADTRYDMNTTTAESTRWIYNADTASTAYAAMYIWSQPK